MDERESRTLAQEQGEQGSNFDPEAFFRTCQRLQQLFKSPPAALAPALKFPEVFVLIAVRMCVTLLLIQCHGVSCCNKLYVVV
jgi:hypothetical protein